MYEVIVLGATFTAAGIARKYKDDCLVIERRAQAGYEFFGAQSFDPCEGLAIYQHLKECHTLFRTEVVSVTQNGDCFVCETHSVDGFCSYEAKKVIDTRCTADMSIAKTYNMLIKSEETPDFPNSFCQETSVKNRYVVRCAVPLDCGFGDARLLALDIVQSFSETQRLILLADEFDYQVKSEYPNTKNGIIYLPSKAYNSPESAFEAGLNIAEEV